MKTKTRIARRINPLLVIIIVVFLLLCTYASVALWTKMWPFMASESMKSSNKTTDVNATNIIKAQASTSTTDPSQTSDKIPTSSTMTANITQLTEDSNNNILFTATIDGSSNSGACTVTFSNPNDRPYVQEVDSTEKGDQKICGPIVIPSQNFSYLGQWNVNLRFFAGNEQATASGTIDIR